MVLFSGRFVGFGPKVGKLSSRSALEGCGGRGRGGRGWIFGCFPGVVAISRSPGPPIDFIDSKDAVDSRLYRLIDSRVQESKNSKHFSIDSIDSVDSIDSRAEGRGKTRKEAEGSGRRRKEEQRDGRSGRRGLWKEWKEVMPASEF